MPATSVQFEQARWISAPARKESNQRPADYFRSEFVLNSPVARASLRYSGLGVVEPWLNGARVHEDYFTPGWSDYRKRAYVSTYDVGELLEPGVNCLGMILADGWAGAPFGPKGHAVAYAPRTMLVAELEVVYADGSKELIVSGEDWQWSRGAVCEQSLYHGEFYDARKVYLDWASSGAKKRGWKPVEVVESPTIQLTDKKCPPVRVIEALKARSLKRSGDTCIVDFGQNLVGVVRIQFRDTKPGQKIILRYAEMLEADGSLYTENLRAAKATDVYVCEGGALESYQPRFTFHGFRYAEITGYAELKPGDIRACVMHNDLTRTGQFECSNALVNQLQSCIVWGQRGNFLEAPTDCPQRDERLGWSGDAQVFAATACFNYDCEGFYRQWMDAMRDGQREDGAFPDVAPDILGWHGNAGWGDAGVIVPYIVWQHYGSPAILEENWSAMQRYMNFLINRSQGFIQSDTVYGDWLAVDALKPQWGPTPKDLIGTAYFARCAQYMSKMATALGKAKQASSYASLFQRIKAAFQARFVTSEGLVLGDTQTSYLLALAFDLLPDGLMEAAGERLAERIESRDWHLSTGFLGTPLLNPVLSKIGRSDIAYKLLKNETYPSWLYPIMNGATTMWERWNSWTEENGFGPVEMNSFNHYAYGAIGEWLYQRVAGIAPHPEHPGYQYALLAPMPGGALSSGGGTLITRSGRFVSQWRVSGAKFRWNCTIPGEAKALLSIPAEKWSQIRLNGKPVPASRRKGRVAGSVKTCKIELPAGTYRIEITSFKK